MASPKILLEGRPGIGKTTVARRLVEVLRMMGASVSGFTTEEIRDRGRRLGFRVESLFGSSAVLAHVDLSGPPRVGKYGVDLPAFERVVLPAITQPVGVVVIDELGRMELASEPFRDVVSELFDAALPIVATVHAFAHPFTDTLKRRRDVRTIRVVQGNRDALPDELAELVA